jgi:hypothetical protein
VNQSRALVVVVVSQCIAGCIHAPNVVIVDRKTALEQQALGSFRGLEESLEQAGLSPRPAPLTSGELAEAGVAAEDDRSAQPPGVADALQVDALLVRRCVGEANDATLTVTVAQCTGVMDVPTVNRLIERQNRNRRQLWHWLAEKSPGRNESEIRATWRKIHFEGMVCRGHFQSETGAWEVKRCGEG